MRNEMEKNAKRQGMKTKRAEKKSICMKVLPSTCRNDEIETKQVKKKKIIRRENTLSHNKTSQQQGGKKIIIEAFEKSRKQETGGKQFTRIYLMALISLEAAVAVEAASETVALPMLDHWSNESLKCCEKKGRE